MFIFGDGRHGHELVKSVCRYMEKKHRCAKCFVAVVDRSFEKEMKDISTKYCAIEAIEMRKLKQSPEELERAMKKHSVDWLVMQPSGDSFSNLEEVKTVLECYKKHGGQNVIMNSVAKCDKCEDHPLKDCHMAEQMVKQHFPKTHVILRVQLPLMDLDFFADAVREQRKWMLPTGQANFAPVSTKRDLACCMGHIVKEQRMEQKYAGQTFTLTNREKVNGERLAQMTGSAFNEDVGFQNISIEECRKILDRYLGGGGEGGDEDQQQGRRQLRRRLLNRAERDMLLAVFKMICNGQYDFTTEDVKKITGMDPMGIEEYLRKREGHLRGSSSSSSSASARR